jgi:hypothetical protein
MSDHSKQYPTASETPKEADKPLSKSLLGDSDAGGLAGQGGMVDPAIDADEDDQQQD